ncbi:hypothetical protein [Oceanithermus sp.]|uniref:hypothetical protein n=1 Tax=Oceanithermus sp. TaxID=2268145 RepID=UPI00257E9BF0|nr:hypothetical protein [Oceanithermus sp.]
MNREEFRPLGVAMTRLLARIRRLIEGRLIPDLLERPSAARGTIVDVIGEAWMSGALTGYMVHGAYLEAPASMPPSLARPLAEQALEHADWTAARIRETLADREATIAVVSLLARSSTEASAWMGHDTAARGVANMMEAGFKRWVRSWPRKEEREHSSLEGQVLPEPELFTLPSGARVYGPRDWDRYPESSEWINCGHALVYLREVTPADVLYNPPTQSAVYGRP